MWRLRTNLGLGLFAAVSVGALVTPTVDLPPPPPPTVAAPPQPAVTETVLERRETLEGALVRSGVAPADAKAMIGALRDAVDMRRLRPGERLSVSHTRDGGIAGVCFSRSPMEQHSIRRDADRWRVETVRPPVETRVVGVAGRLEDSLFASMERLGESAALTAAFVKLFEWDFDFAADSLPGDRFRLLVEKRYAKNEFVGYGNILVAQYQSAGRPLLTSVGFRDTPGETPTAARRTSGEAPLPYYDAAGRSVKKMFLRAPLDFTRITSGFSHARHHPILGGVRPHLAIDYGAPIGTPVRAVADSLVVSAGWAGDYGISVVLRHARGYETMYNHLSATLVRPGQRVRQRQVIGRVGSTGLSTGPHLDYRVSRNGQFVNPLGEKFIPGAPVPPERRKAFHAHLAALLERLDRTPPLKGGPAGS